MRKTGNPTYIGIFVVGATVLAVATVLFLGSLNLFTSTRTFVIYFEESINGLNQGAPVKFRGVPIGRVSDIRIRFNQPPDSFKIPVFVDIDARRLERQLGLLRMNESDNFLEREIGAGLHARLQFVSIITGQLFVELDFVEVPPGYTPPSVQREPLLPEIPAQPSPMAAFSATAAEFLSELGSIDLAGINDALIATLGQAQKTMAEVDAARLSRDLTRTLHNIDTWLANIDVQSVIDEFGRLLPQLSESTAQTLLQAQHSLAILEQLGGQLESMLDPNSALPFAAREALQELSSSSRSLRDLVEFLQQQPGSLLHGRAPQAPLPRQ